MTRLTNVLAQILIALLPVTAFGQGIDNKPGVIRDADTGIQQKIIVGSDGASVFEDLSDVDSDDLQKEFLPAFTIRYQYQLDKSDTGEGRKMAGGREWIRIGVLDTPGSSDGWVDASQVFFWRTRSALQPSGNLNRPFQVFETNDLSGDPLAQHLGQEKDGHLSLAIILEPPADRKMPLYPVVFYNGALDAEKRQQPTAKKVSQDIPMEIVFVIDTTLSMTVLLDGVKDIADEVATLLQEPGVEKSRGLIRFGLVEYQDKVPGLVPARVRIPLTDAASFRREIASVNVVGFSSGDSPEDGIAGLVLAMQTGTGSASGQTVGWSKISSRHLVVVGDASFHEPPNPKCTTGLTIDQIMAMARPEVAQGTEAKAQLFNLHAIVAKNDGDPDDNALCQRLFERLAKNNSTDSKDHGVFSVVDPNVDTQRKSVVSELVRIASDTSLAIEDPEQFVKNVEQGKGVSPAAMAYWRMRSDLAPEGVHHGWCRARDKEFKETAVESLFVSRKEMRLLKSRLSHVIAEFTEFKGDAAGRGNTGQLLDLLKLIFGSVHTGDSITEETSLAEMVQGLPLQNNALRISIRDIATMNDESFEKWLEELTYCRNKIEELVGEAGWFEIDADRKVECRFLDITLLP